MASKFNLSGIVCADITPEIIHKNNKLIAKISIEDLDYLEKDLEFNEKVSVVFLLYGDKNTMTGLQKLLVDIQSCYLGKPTTFLSEWARTGKNERWREYLLEALCISNLNHCISKLGLNLDDLKERYIPHNPETNLFIHPILKVLYIMSENLTPVQAKNLICHMRSNHIIGAEYTLPELLEIHLLDWIQKRIIILGQYEYKKPNIKATEFCDLKSIIAFLKAHEMDHLADILKQTTIRINFTKFNLITSDNKSVTTGIHKDCNVELSETPCIAKATGNTSSVSPSRTNFQSKNPFTINNRYKILKETAGYILIINQKIFKKTDDPTNQLKCREGTDADKNRLKSTFEKFGYEAIVGDDLKADEITNLVTSVVAMSIDKDSLIVCILSHGRVGTFYSSDSKQVKISSIKKLMESAELNGKPKFLVVQACQIPQMDPNTNLLSLTDVEQKDVKQRYDTITAWSTIPGTVSYRHTHDGTWFIQTICESIENLGSEYHMGDILTEVCAKLKDRKGPNNEAMVVNTETNLVKQFYLPK